MLVAPLVLLVAFSSAAPFDDAKAKARQVKSLKLALKALAEPCDLYDVGGRECQERQKAVQKKLRKKHHYLYLGITEQGLQIESKKGSKIGLSWTPFVDGGGNVALTIGKPLKLSKSGGPVMRLKKLNATLADGVFDSDLERAVRLGQVAVEVVGTFGKVWEKSYKGKPVRGVMFKPTHLRLSNSRNGKPLADVQF
ncbi:MAG: hypothetical protein GY822_05490 [Deltaproteobacteria bacterium]|nr:hypothetical protein [Deltaproteobacteria bacterium]